MAKIAIVGAYGGIGTKLVEKLAGDHELFLMGRNPEKLTSLATKHATYSAVFDATKSAEVDEAFKQAVEQMGGLDAAVCLVGSLLLKPAHMTRDEEFRDTLETNLFTAFAVVRAAARAMMRSGGSIVLMASAAARIGISNHEAIGAAKAGVIGLGISAAATYAPRGIRVNVVAPGMVETSLTEKLLESEAAKKASASLHALKKLGKPEEVAHAIAWLLQPESRWITGQILGVDGGLSSILPRPEVSSRQ